MSASTAVAQPRLFTVGVVLSAVGLGLALVAMRAPSVLDTLYTIAATSGTPVAISGSAQIGASVAGALMVGWGVMLALLARGHAPPTAAVISAVAWFVVDSAASLFLGFGWNALSNILFLLLFLTLWPHPAGAHVPPQQSRV